MRVARQPAERPAGLLAVGAALPAAILEVCWCGGQPGETGKKESIHGATITNH